MFPRAGSGTSKPSARLRVARRSAIKAKTQAANQLHALVLTAPDPLRHQLRSLSLPKLVATAARLRTGQDPAVAGTKIAMATIAKRWQHLDDEIRALDTHLRHLVSATAPALIARHGVGIDTAGALLVAIGDNPHRLRTEASFAALCGVTPLDASSGQQPRHRLNRGGDRTANQALWRIALVRMSNEPRTRDYVTRRTTQGRSKKEIIRCLKRYIARELYPDLLALTE